MIHKRVEISIGFEHHVGATSSVAAVWTSVGDELLTAKGHDTVRLPCQMQRES